MLQRIADSKRPVVILGSLATRRAWGKELARCRGPLFTTASAKGILDESSPYSAGVFTETGKELAPESHLFENADLVIGAGLRNTEVVTPHAFGAPLIILDEAASGLFPHPP